MHNLSSKYVHIYIYMYLYMFTHSLTHKHTHIHTHTHFVYFLDIFFANKIVCSDSTACLQCSCLSCWTHTNFMHFLDIFFANKLVCSDSTACLQCSCLSCWLLRVSLPPWATQSQVISQHTRMSSPCIHYQLTTTKQLANILANQPVQQATNQPTK